MKIRELLQRDPMEHRLTSVVKITDHNPENVWVEMSEYVPTSDIHQFFRDVLDALLETRRGATERVCAWVWGFFGSGKSHLLKVLGYLLEDRELHPPGGRPISSQEFLCKKLGLEDFLPILRGEFRIKVLFINLLDHDPQSPERPTISRIVYRRLLEEGGLASEFWVAAWEREFERLGLWEEFRKWVKGTFGREWEEERDFHPEAVLRRALSHFLGDRYSSEEEAERAIEDSKRRFGTVNPSDVVRELVEEAERLDDGGAEGRVVVLLDEVGLYIGDSVPRLTDLNIFAEQVAQAGEGRVLLVVTAQEMLTDLVPRLTADRQLLEWLKDRFRLTFPLPTADVREIVARRLLEKTPEGAESLREYAQRFEGGLRASLCLGRGWGLDDFVRTYPLPPHYVQLVQDIQGTIRSSLEEARRLSGSERSLLMIVHSILKGERGLEPGAEREVGWLVSLDLIYDAMAADLAQVRSEQERAMREIEALGEVDGLPVSRIAKALFLLQQVRTRYPCTLENIASALVSHVEEDFNELKEKVRKGLERLQKESWVAVEDEGSYRLLTPPERLLEQEVKSNWPSQGELSGAAREVVRDILKGFRYEHGGTRRPLKVAIAVDGQPISEEGALQVELLTPFGLSETDARERIYEEKKTQSVIESDTIFWVAEDIPELRATLGRAEAIRKTLDRWRGRSFSDEERRRVEELEKERRRAVETRLPDLMRRAFMEGRIFINGQEIHPSGRSFEEELKKHLRSLARDLFTEFVDVHVRDADCSAILPYRPGERLPEAYHNLGLVGSDGSILKDAKYLKIMKAEIEGRRSKGLERTGRALVERFEGPPYGWDPRVVRLLVATLFKMGAVAVDYQGRRLDDPSDPQAEVVFAQARAFGRASFDTLPEVDWREARDLARQTLGAPQGDTFERTAEIVRAKTQEWAQKAAQIATRCRDNGLPPNLVQICDELKEVLADISSREEPNERLRRFLGNERKLKEAMPTLQALDDPRRFDFDKYRNMKNFVRAARAWARDLPEDLQRRWRNLEEGLNAADLLDRWESLQSDYALLWPSYREDYKRRHEEFQEEVKEALEALRQHEAFKRSPKRAEGAIRPLLSERCDATGEPREGEFACPQCGKPFEALDPSLVHLLRQEVEAKLDNLLPKPSPEKVEPLSLERTVREPKEVTELAGELRRYVRRAGRPVRVRIEARPERGERR